MRRALIVIAPLLLAAGPATAVAGAQTKFGEPGAARPFMAMAHRDLQFGEVLPGIPGAVASSDPRFAGLFEIQGGAGGPVRIEFLLPPALHSSFGSDLPIAFQQGDGQADHSRGRFQGVFFDPRTPLVADLGPNGKLWVRLGGTVFPTRDQAGGVYAATVAITVFDLGI